MARYGLQRLFTKGIEAGTYATIEAATAAAQELADELNESVRVMDTWDTASDGRIRARAIKKNVKARPPSKQRRVALDVDTGRAPANERRTKAKPKVKAPARYSKLGAMSGFLPNPLGEYYFNDPVTGATVWARTAAEIMRKAQRRSNETGKRIKTYFETLGEPQRVSGTRYRSNPVQEGPIRFRYSDSSRTLREWMQYRRSAREKALTAAKRYAREHGAAGIHYGDDSYTLYYMEGDKLKSKTWASSKPIY